MRLTYGNLVKGLYLVLFTVSSITAIFKYHTNSTLIAGLSLVGFIAFDIICQLKRKETPDLSKEFAELKERNQKLEQDFQIIKDNISMASAAGIFKKR